ncbi:MAG TPA: Rrf2 family transcriptional regulator [Treponemataceae bacterium]|nr:Rrf2 family transcriptional regulator [Treponemataceae bacterium]
MRISTRGRYSLEALLYLCLLPQGESASTRAIAAGTGISDGYLEQLFIPLKRDGIVRGIRGPQGGYLPGRTPERITVGEVLRSVEGSLEPVACLSDETCPAEATCPTRSLWSRIAETIAECVDSISLDDLATAYRLQGSGEAQI